MGLIQIPVLYFVPPLLLFPGDPSSAAVAVGALGAPPTVRGVNRPGTKYVQQNTRQSTV